MFFIHNHGIMKVFYNRWIPFGSFYAINIFGMVFVRKGRGRMSEVTRNHEFIHTLQQRELLFLGFYLRYFLEWLWRLLSHRNLMKAYHAISFEREAYAHQHDLNYSQHRRHFAWLYS